MTRYIILEGPIGTGKSYLLTKLSKYYDKATFIGEYIEEEAGKQEFAAFREGRISTSDFQYYILNYWKRKLEFNEPGTYFLERGPLAGLAFCDSSSMKNYYNFEKEILDFMKNINMLHFTVIRINSGKGLSDYLNVIDTTPGNIVLFLERPAEECMNNIAKRGRYGEGTYTTEFIRSNSEKLYHLYTKYEVELKIELNSLIN